MGLVRLSSEIIGVSIGYNDKYCWISELNLTALITHIMSPV